VHGDLQITVLITTVGTLYWKRAPGRPPKRWKESWQSTSQELIQRNRQN